MPLSFNDFATFARDCLLLSATRLLSSAATAAAATTVCLPAAHPALSRRPACTHVLGLFYHEKLEFDIALCMGALTKQLRYVQMTEHGRQEAPSATAMRHFILCVDGAPAM